MRKVDESRAANYIRKHSNYKKWLAFVLCLSLLTGTVTLYILNKPATAMTEEGAESIGAILETASNADEETLIQQTLENKAESNEGSGDNLFSEFVEGGDGNNENAGSNENGGENGDELNKLGDVEENKDGLVEEEAKEGEVKEGELKEGEEQKEETEEEEDELTQDVVLTVSYVDEDGEAIADEKEIDINDSIDLASEAPSIEGYTFKEATFKGDVITKVAVKKNADDIRYYEVTFDGDETKEIKKDATVVLTYTADEKKELVLTASYVDEDGKEIADEKELEIAESFDPKKDAEAIEGYTFKEAKVDDKVVTLITVKEDEESGLKYFEATLDDESVVEIREDKTAIFTYAEFDSEVVITAKFVDKAGEEIQDPKELAIGDEIELKKSSITEVDEYFFYKATYEETEITKISPVYEEEAKTEDKDSKKEDSEEESVKKAIGYEFTTADGDKVEITEDAEIELTYLKASTETEFTFEDGRISVKATVNGKNVFPEGIELKASEVTRNSTDYNYDAYMDALNENAESIAKEAGQDKATEFTTANTLLYDIAFMFEEKELQPAEGSVNISIEFKKNQLSNELEVVDDKEITVIHLPIKDEVKEADEFTSTKEATDITSADIEVKTLTDATSEISDVEKVEFEESSFSVFVINGDQLNTWNGSKNITLSDFSGISSLFNHSVVANRLDTTDHIEGSVRVGQYHTNSNGAVVNQNSERIQKNPTTEIVVEKTVINGNDGEFTFGFFDSKDDSLIKQFTISTDGLKGQKVIKNTDEEFSSVFDILNSRAVHVYELDGTGSKVTEEWGDGSYTVTYSYSDFLGGEQTEIANDHDANYIGEFVTDGTLSVEHDFFHTDENYVGQTWTVEPKERVYSFSGYGNFNVVHVDNPNMFTYVDGLKEIIAGDISKSRDVSASLADAKNYPAKGQTIENTTSNVINVINLKSTTGQLSKDLKEANFDNSKVIEGLLRQDQYLLINISVDSDSYILDGSGIHYDNYDQTQERFGKLASHIIYNFVGPVGDGGIPTSPYEGEVKISGVAAGLILAPGAYVNQIGGDWNGEIIADRVKHGGAEIHERSILSGKTVKVEITNTGKIVYNANISLHKYLNGTLSETPFSFTVRVLDREGNLVEPKGLYREGNLVEPKNVTNDGNGLISFEARDIGQYVRVVGTNNEKTVFFLIKENEVSSEFVKDESYIIAKVTRLDDEQHFYQYFRVDASEKAEIDENPEKIATYTKYSLSDENAAFYNKSYSLILKKEWKNQDGSKIEGAIISTFSPVNLAVMRTYEGESGPITELYETVNLGGDNGFTATLSGVPRYTDDGKEYTYFIQEKNSSNEPIPARDGIEYYKIVNSTSSTPTINYEDVSVTLGDDVETIVLVCVNTKDLNVLPSTGGVGDIPYMAAGAGTAIAGLLGSGLYYKKKKDDDQKEE